MAKNLSTNRMHNKKLEEELEQNFVCVDFFSELKESLAEALAYSKGRRSDEMEVGDSLDCVIKSMSSEDLQKLLKTLLNGEASEQVANLVRKILHELRNRAPEMTNEDWELIRPIAQQIFHLDIKVE